MFDLILCLLIPASAGERPKVGLVLSGGAAMGFAHIGALQLIDSLNIPIDYVAGTSMGGLIGALYAIGYSGDEIERIALDMDWEHMFTDNPPRNQMPYFQKIDAGKYQLEFGIENWLPAPSSGLVKGQNIGLEITGLTYPYEHITNFDELPIPFRCTAVDLNSGKLIILQEGSLAKAMRSTMSIPSVFSPVTWGDSLLVDGGLLDNCPVATAKDMGADIIIAVSVGWISRTYTDLKYGVDILIESGNVVRRAALLESVKGADLHINTELESFRGVDFSRADISDIIMKGKKAAFIKRDELIALRKSLDPYLLNFENNRYKQTDLVRISSVEITGNTYLPFGMINEQINIRAQDYLDSDTLEDRIAEMSASGLYAYVSYRLIPYDENTVKILIKIADKNKPKINGIRIEGNRRLSFTFIYRLLGIRPGDSFDKKLVRNRIENLYGLGYFEKIDYIVEPINEKRVNLTFKIKETSLRKFRLGIGFDSRYSFVAMVNLQGTDIFLPGVRWDNTVQFLGLNKFESKLFYPSRTLEFPIYPFLKFYTVDIPIDIYNPIYGNKEAVYRYRSIQYSCGAGIQHGRDWILEGELLKEYLGTVSDVGFSEINLNPDSTKTVYSGFRVNFKMDRLDNYAAPRKGIKINIEYLGYYHRLDSDIGFSKYELTADYFLPIRKLHSVRFYLRYGGGEGIPEVKHFILGGPDNFIGINYNQLFVSEYSFARLDYRYLLTQNFMLVTSINVIPKAAFELLGLSANMLTGAGVGMAYSTPAGPIELLYSQGPYAVFGKNSRQLCLYFKAGYRF